MYFKVNVIFIILSYLSINVALETTPAPIPGEFHCYVKMPPIDTGFMPIPYYRNVTKPTMIRPDGKGNYFLPHLTQITMACVGSSFVSPTRYAVSELPVTCVNGFLEYRGRPLYFNSFKCKTVPKSSIKLTRMECNNDEYNSILEVGFQTRNNFLKTYRVCFDMIQKRSLYAWYFVDSPIMNVNQIQVSKPEFTLTRLYDGINLTSTYLEKNQRRELIRTFNSSETADKYLSHRFITPGFLLSPSEFTYVYEQHSLYYYENTVALWSDIKSRAWTVIERLVKRNMVRGSNRHLVVAGSYDTCTLVDDEGSHKELYLSTFKRVPVPKFIWKMDYDVDRRSGTVFIGYNHPFDNLNKSMHFCDTVKCPGELSRVPNVDNLVFCCTKDSFERVYGNLDHHVFQRFE